jgi:hypothetical protein
MTVGKKLPQSAASGATHRARASRTAGTSTSARLSSGDTAARVRSTRIADRAESVIDAVGGVRALAELMDVSPSQPTRWRRGQEQPSPKNSRELVDLDYVFARAALIWEPRVIADWLTGSNAFLDGASPIDVLRTRGPVDVIAALDAEASGTFA